MELTTKQKELYNLLDGTLSTAPADVAQNNVDWYKEWKPQVDVAKGERQWELVDGEKILFECIAPAGLPAGNNLYKPSETPAIWKRVWLEEWPEWRQPLGSHDAYSKGAKVTHNAKKWISNVDANVWEPGVYGWDEAKGE